MEKVKDERFDRTEVILDGKEFADCSFENCMMVYSGDADCAFARCTFKDCMWLFEGAKGRTMRFSG